MSKFLRNLGSLLFVGASVSTSNDIYSHCSQKQTNNTNESSLIGVYLTPKSIELLQNYLKKNGYNQHASISNGFIAIRGYSLDEDLYIYEPLFGDRAAFRLKGLIIPTNKDDTIVALGRVSTVMGEIKDDDYEASLPLYITAKISEYDRNLLDLPTRFVAENKDIKTKWSGKLPGKRVIDIKHTPTTVTYEPIPFNQQLLIDGFICSSKYYDKTNGKCNFDRIEAMKKDIEKRKESESNIKPTADNIPSTSISESITPSVTEEVNTSASTTEQEKQQANECPVCKYMKGGPCKAEFITWDNCVQELKEDGDLNTCFPHTVKLMECMRKEEYYDIMNVGNDYTHAVAQEETKEKK